MKKDCASPEREHHVVYQIHVDLPTGRMTYTGHTSQGLRSVKSRVSRKMGRLMNGVPDPASDHSRAVHLACAAAMIEGWPMSVELKGRKESRAQAEVLERRLMEEVALETSLNGPSWSLAVDLFRQIIADHLQRQGLQPDRIERALAVTLSPGRLAPRGDAWSNERGQHMHHREPMP